MLAVCCSANGEELAAPVDVQYTFFCKALSFDRAMSTRCGEDVVIAVLYQRRFRASLSEMEEFRGAASASDIQSVNTLPITVVAIDLEDEGWRQAVLGAHADILVVTNVRAISVASITEFSRARQILTMATEPSLVNDGISISLMVKAGRPRFKINLAAAKAEGADFSSQLLNLADLTE